MTYRPLAYGNPIFFAGYFYDSETGLDHVRHRMYSPTLQHWLQRDPLAEVWKVKGVRLLTDSGLGEPFGAYVYCDDSPAVRVDPSGLCNRRTLDCFAQCFGFRDFCLTCRYVREATPSGPKRTSCRKTLKTCLYNCKGCGFPFNPVIVDCCSGEPPGSASRRPLGLKLPIWMEVTIRT